ncbi:MAG: glycosyltransferase family 4 protein [Spirochaetales bacterium]|nr:glycosyltransferase family 4 protein [Spirochaetales bacterium]
MNIQYVALADFENDREVGIINKINGEVKALKTLKHNIDLFCLAGASVVRKSYEADGPVSQVIDSRKKHGVARRFFSSVRRHVYPGVDLVYIRYPMCSLWFLSFLRRVIKKTGCRIYLEFPTFPYDDEYAARLSRRAKLLLDRLTRNRLKKYVYRAVNMSGDDAVFGIPTVSASNGIDTDAYRPIERRPDDSSVNLVFVGNLAYWQGVDKLLVMMKEYAKNHAHAEVVLHVAGSGTELDGLRQLAEELSLNGMVRFHGTLRGAALDDLFSRADLAFGCMAIERKSLTKVSALKTIEYAARGVPFVVNYDDINFRGDLPFVIRSRDLNLADILEERQSREAQFGELSVHARRYAEERLSWENMMKKVLGT